ncbi:MAG: hypothetical protein EOO08_00590 [Chitinophagaceae bacterium]|nr:MAG: hypothetical protein EOO08_00590 [Chitinophagaceae bacterium]
MNQRQMNTHESLKDVLTHLDAHGSKWEGVEPIAESVEALRTVQSEIRLSALVQADSTTGNTTAKNLALALAAEKAYTMSRRICAWARKKGRSEVLEAVDFPLSALRQGAEEEVFQRQQLVLKYATDLGTDLAAYKVGSAEIDDLKQALSAYESLKQGRNEKRKHRIYSTTYLDGLFEQASNQLQMLDDEVKGLIDDKAFVETYFIARRKTDRKATRGGAGSDSPGKGS